MRNGGLLVLLFCAYQVWGTALVQAREQARLKDAFREALVPDSPSAPTAGGEDGTQDEAARRPGGAVIAIISIPELGLEQAVVEGTSPSDLRAGPGHYSGTPMPGQHGNVAIAGHRTTFGAPFRRLNELTPGDLVTVTTTAGDFHYAVSGPATAVDPDAGEVIGDQGDDRLTLTTCHPPFSDSERLIVVARPTTVSGTPPPRLGDPVDPLPRTRLEAVVPPEGSFKVPVAGWALLGVVLIGVFRRLRGPSPVLAYVLVVPLGVLTLFHLFDYLSRLLPAGA